MQLFRVQNHFDVGDRIFVTKIEQIEMIFNSDLDFEKVVDFQISIGSENINSQIGLVSSWLIDAQSDALCVCCQMTCQILLQLLADKRNYHSFERLKRAKIFTIQPQKINLAGAINLALFDKTGTLTEDKFDFVGVHENDLGTNRFQELRKTNFRYSLYRIAYTV